MIGDIVVVHAENQPRSHWKLGIIGQLMIGADGEVRAESQKCKIELVCEHVHVLS